MVINTYTDEWTDILLNHERGGRRPRRPRHRRRWKGFEMGRDACTLLPYALGCVRVSMYIRSLPGPMDYVDGMVWYGMNRIG